MAMEEEERAKVKDGSVSPSIRSIYDPRSPTVQAQRQMGANVSKAGAFVKDTVPGMRRLMDMPRSIKDAYTAEGGGFRGAGAAVGSLVRDGGGLIADSTKQLGNALLWPAKPAADMLSGAYRGVSGTAGVRDTAQAGQQLQEMSGHGAGTTPADPVAATEVEQQTQKIFRPEGRKVAVGGMRESAQPKQGPVTPKISPAVADLRSRARVALGDNTDPEAFKAKIYELAMADDKAKVLEAAGRKGLGDSAFLADDPYYYENSSMRNGGYKMSVDASNLINMALGDDEVPESGVMSIRRGSNPTAFVNPAQTGSQDFGTVREAATGVADQTRATDAGIRKAAAEAGLKEVEAAELPGANRSEAGLRSAQAKEAEAKAKAALDPRSSEKAKDVIIGTDFDGAPVTAKATQDSDGNYTVPVDQPALQRTIKAKMATMNPDSVSIVDRWIDENPDADLFTLNAFISEL